MLGYAADGRSLRIKDPDAEVIRAIFDLYLAHRNVRLVKEEVDRRGMKTPVRTLMSGRGKGGSAFSHGHLHYILTNPVYAGRIRHHDKVYPGQHEPLIAPDVWDGIQESLKADSSKARTIGHRNRGSARKSVSPLAGKIFDHTGDRLTPSHTKTAKGRRLRYYVSHRLVRGSTPRDPSGWRLPGPELETFIAGLIRNHLRTPAFATRIVTEATTDEISAIANSFEGAVKESDGAMGTKSNPVFDLAERIDIAPGEIRISASV